MAQSSEKDKRKLMQIGFAALMARKLEPIKQYIFERRGRSGFVFEPVLRGNEAIMGDDEYLRKKYYSQVVYEASKAGELNTSINEPNIDKKAAKRLWAGRQGTGYKGTGKGGYMQELDPGVDSVPAGDTDALMQMYLKYQTEKVQVLTKKSHMSTVDLFRRIANASTDNIPPELSFQNYMPAPRDMGVSKDQASSYLRPYGPGDTAPPANTSSKEQKAYVEKSIRNFQSKYRDEQPNMEHMGHLGGDPSSIEYTFASAIGDAQGSFARHLSTLGLFGKKSDGYPLTNDDYTRLTSTRSQNYQASVKATDVAGNPLGSKYEIIPQDVGVHLSDYAEEEHYGNPLGPRGGKGAAPSIGPSSKEGSGIITDGGTTKFPDNQFYQLERPLVTQFKRDKIEDLFPKSFKAFQKERLGIHNMKARNEGMLLNQELDYTTVELNNESDVREFINWMRFELNKEQSDLNSYFGRPGKGILEGMTIYKKDGGLIGTKGDMSVPSGYDINARGEWKRGLKDMSSSLDTITSAGGHKAEIIKGFLGDFTILSDEYGYKMNQTWEYIKGSEGEKGGMGWKNQSRLERGVDMFFPLNTPKGQPGLINVKVRARVIEGTDPQKMPSVGKSGMHRTYVQLMIEDINYIPDLPRGLQEEEVVSIKREQSQVAYNIAMDEFYRNGATAIYQGGAMMTHAGVGSKMFMGDRSPVNSVGFFTSTVSTGDFADRLQFLVNEACGQWFGDPEGFEGFFDLHQMEGGAFREWAVKWDAEARQLEKDINKKIQMKWSLWLDQYAGGGKTAAPPSIAKSWGGPIKLGPFVHSTKYFGQAQSIGRRPHGYYVQGDWEGGPLG